MRTKKINEKLSVSLVVPVFNEQEIIAETIDVFMRDLALAAAEYELIIVDDGSTDETENILNEYSRKYQNHLKVIRNKRNMGSGRSLTEGFKYARYPVVMTNFADRPFDLKELNKILPLFLDEVDFIVVCRTNRSANNFYRKITSLVNYSFIRFLFKESVGDFQFIQIYRKNILDDLKIESRRTFVAPEIILRALRKGYRMKEYTTTFYPRNKGKAKCGHPKVILRTLYDMCKFWLKLRSGRNLT